MLAGPDGKPLLLLAHRGEGRVALLLSDQVWLWARGFEGGGPEIGAGEVFAEDLIVELPDPKFRVVVPGLAQVQLGPHPMASQNPSARLLGSSPLTLKANRG